MSIRIDGNGKKRPLFIAICTKGSAHGYSTFRIVMSDDIAPAFALLSHSIRTVLAHSHTVSVALGGYYGGIALDTHIKACGAQTECKPYIVSCCGLSAHIG